MQEVSTEIDTKWLLRPLSLRIKTTYEAKYIYVDSPAAQGLAVNKQVFANSQHSDLKYHYVKAARSSGIIVWRDVASKDNLANLSTKVLGSKLWNASARKSSYEIQSIRKLTAFYLTLNVDFQFCAGALCICQ